MSYQKRLFFVSMLCVSILTACNTNRPVLHVAHPEPEKRQPAAYAPYRLVLKNENLRFDTEAAKYGKLISSDVFSGITDAKGRTIPILGANRSLEIDKDFELMHLLVVKQGGFGSSIAMLQPNGRKIVGYPVSINISCKNGYEKQLYAITDEYGGTPYVEMDSDECTSRVDLLGKRNKEALKALGIDIPKSTP